MFFRKIIFHTLNTFADLFPTNLSKLLLEYEATSFKMAEKYLLFSGGEKQKTEEHLGFQRPDEVTSRNAQILSSLQHIKLLPGAGRADRGVGCYLQVR